MTLWSADLKWNELVSIISLFFIRVSWKFGFSRQVFAARYYLYGVEVFFKQIFVYGPLGKIKYAICVEFQVFGSAHVRCFLWVVNAPVLTSRNKEEYAAFVDQTVLAFLLKKNEDLDLNGLVKLHQLHRHLRRCRKYKN